MAGERTVRVEGLRELSRAFAVADKTLSKELRKGLRDAAKPVATSAELFADTRIRNMGPPSEGQDWRRMRVGVTRTLVYVAPRSRGAGGKRSRRGLFDLMLGRSLEPALDANVEGVTRAVDNVLATVGQAWDRA